MDAKINPNLELSLIIYYQKNPDWWLQKPVFFRKALF
jgi:hypothetical protein